MSRAATSEPSPVTSGRPRRRAQNWLFMVVFLALVAGTVAGFVLARDRALQTAERQSEQASAGVAASLEAEVRQLSAGLAGSASIIGPDGALAPDVFAAFAADLLADDEVHGLTLVEVVAAPGSRTQFPVVAMEPESTGDAPDGVDLGTDASRSPTLRAAVRTQAPTVSDVVDLTSTGAPGLEIVRPLVDRTGQEPVVRGLLVVEVPMGQLVETAREATAAGTDVALVDGEDLIFGTAFDRKVRTTRASANVPGRTWTVVVGPAREPDLTPAWMEAAGGVAAILAMLALMIATERHQRRLARANGLLTRAEERSRAVQEVAGRLARALSGGEIVTALLDHLPAAVGAESAVIATVDEAGRLELLGPEEPTRANVRFLEGADHGSIVRTTLTQRAPAWLSSPLGWRGDEATATLAAGGSALALLPLTADGVVGVLAVSYPRIRIFAEDEQALLQTVGILAARALARGRRYDAEHRTAIAFQHAALPDDLPVIEGLTIAARYRPATRQATIGGDWYDVLVLDERRVVLVVGDVVGHGLAAAAAMGRLRTAFQTIASLSADPGTMLQAMSNQTTSIPDSFCTTIICVVVDLESGSMTWCRAGHPPPLVIGGGNAELLDESGLPPLGVVPDGSPPVHSRTLDVGDVVILYTDGVIERRGESIDDGLERLGIVAEHLADLEPEEFSDALVEALVPAEEQGDDLAVLVVRFDGCASASVPDAAVTLAVGGAS